MNDYLEIIKKIAKVVGLVVPLFTGASAIFKTSFGGRRVFESFASSNRIAVDTSFIKRSQFLEWGREIYSKPISEATANTTYLAVHIILFLCIAIALIYHLLLKEENAGKTTRYYRYHSLISLLVFISLLLCVLLSPTLAMMFMAAALLLIFFIVYMYFNIADIRSHSHVDKLLWIFSWIVIVISMVFAPSVYGQKFFNPEIFCVDEFDHEKQEVKTTGGESITVIFDRHDEKEKILVGYLLKPPIDKNEKRSFNLVEMPLSSFDLTSIKQRSKVSFKNLLKYKYVRPDIEPAIDEERVNDLMQDIIKRYGASGAP